MVAVALPTLVVLDPPAIPLSPRMKVRQPQRVVPAAIVPDVEPVELQDLTPEDAKSFNASVPFVTGPNPPARPFRLTGSTDDLAKATDCLAAAVYYEAGDDAVGQKAVAQVVLNRMRHPAFPKTVCGVVFQGQERSTGCQFTFTCDGAIARYKPSEIAWTRAREVATAALAGAVYRPVGWATHYHTDYVVPYWQSSLDKIAQVHTHLFFRWTGWWGTPPAFNRSRVPGEPAIAKLAALSDAHKLGDALVEAGDALAEAAALTAGQPVGATALGDSFLVRLQPARADDYPAIAQKLCGERAQCKVLGWTAVPPTAEPFTPEQINAMSFSYLRDRSYALERTLWNCAQFRDRGAGQCMKRQTLRLSPAPAASAFPAPEDLRGPTDLGGVRRKPAPQPTPTPTATPRTPPAAAP